MKTTKSVLAIAIGVGFALSVAAAEPGKHPGEKVDLNSLPAAVQNTIKEKAAGGQIVKVMREDDPDGKWNYEVVAKANGKESKFEVDPNGSFVKQHE
jgi:peptidase YpeB-like protein